MNGAIRPPAPAEAAALAALVEETLGGARDPDALLAPSPGAVRRTIADDGGPIAWLEYRVVEDEADLAEIAVAPRARRQGLGRRLVDHLVAEARARGVARIYLEVRAGNAAARALYAATGFSPCGRRRRYYSDGEDAVLYRLDLEGT
ncbi:MAG: ribosomal protein S18-alanine N-acetyltransferase [bacterium]